MDHLPYRRANKAVHIQFTARVLRLSIRYRELIRISSVSYDAAVGFVRAKPKQWNNGDCFLRVAAIRSHVRLGFRTFGSVPELATYSNTFHAIGRSRSPPRKLTPHETYFVDAMSRRHA